MQLVIAEKPSVAQSIASVLGARTKHDGYQEGNGYVISWCFGHLAGLADADVYNQKYAKWTRADLPIIPELFEFRVGEDKKEQFERLKQLMHRSDITAVISKANLAQTAFGVVFGEKFGAIFVAVCLFFFAFSTVLSWNMFGKVNVVYLFGKKNPKLCTVIYTLIALVFIFVGTMVSNDLVWELTDAFNYLMVLPNALALFALSAAVVSCAKLKSSKKSSKK